MAISKIILNGVTQMDVTQDTVTAATLMSPKTAHGADGVQITGTAVEKTLTTKSITANGTYNASSDNADGYSSVTVNVSGGASNIVTGTFKGTTTGAAMDVDIPYTGIGYPLRVLIWVSAEDVATYNSTIQRYACRTAMVDKLNPGTAPDWTSAEGPNQCIICRSYKSSTSNASAYGGAGHSVRSFVDSNATNSTAEIVHIRTNKKISVFIANTTYGFMANIKYEYMVIYSS